MGALSGGKLVAAAAVLAVFALGGELPAWAVAGAVTAVLAVLCAAETAVDRRVRYAASE